MDTTWPAQDVLQVCRNGHVITDRLRTCPEQALGHCDRCGAAAVAVAQRLFGAGPQPIGDDVPVAADLQDVLCRPGGVHTITLTTSAGADKGFSAACDLARNAKPQVTSGMAPPTLLAARQAVL